MMRTALVILVVLGASITLLLYVIGTGRFGNPWQPAEPNATPRPVEVGRSAYQALTRDAESLNVTKPKEILFGDLHVHTTFSVDAFFMSLPSAGGDGLHPVSDACDFARYCSALDFFSVNDHAVSLTSERWRNTIDEVRACNEVSHAGEPDLVAYLGWEWTQAGYTVDTHYGHKNVIVKGLRDDEVPARPISALPAEGVVPLNLRSRPFYLTGLAGLMNGGRQDTLAFVNEFRGLKQCEQGVSVRDLPPECIETAATPEVLFNKLNEWNMETMVIPHGTTWGIYTPPGSRWDKQLNAKQHDPNRQRLIEVYSGHGNSEEYRPFREAIVEKDGTITCPEPANNFVPGCWRAGEITYERCISQDYSARQCNALAAEARHNFVNAKFNAGDKTIVGTTPEDWHDSGQCRDCFMPTFNYRPGGAAQYILALKNFKEDGEADRFRFGFIASSDNHSARPGTGYKEFARNAQTEARFGELPGVQLPPYKKPAPKVRSVPIMQAPASPFVAWNFERAASWFMSGGLVAVHSESRNRDDIWESLWNQEVYATSGPRIMLWFNLKTDAGTLPMGSAVARTSAPVFEVKALGSFEQKSGCPEYTTDALTRNRIETLCNGECFNPADVRRPITRIEVVRVRPQITPNENVATLIDDPWQTFDCPAEGEGCTIEFSDPDFATHKRDSVYYVRAVESPSEAIAGEPYVCQRDANGNCTEITHMCAHGDDDCLSPVEERAWSSPIYVDYAR